MSTKTGGPAFPQDYEHTDVLVKMQQVGDISAEQLIKLSRQLSGMTLRDYFAAKAMQSWVAATTKSYIHCGDHQIEMVDFSRIAEAAYNQADAMLKAREL